MTAAWSALCVLLFLAPSLRFSPVSPQGDHPTQTGHSPPSTRTQQVGKAPSHPSPSPTPAPLPSSRLEPQSAGLPKPEEGFEPALLRLPKETAFAQGPPGSQSELRRPMNRPLGPPRAEKTLQSVIFQQPGEASRTARLPGLLHPVEQLSSRETTRVLTVADPGPGSRVLGPSDYGVSPPAVAPSQSVESSQSEEAFHSGVSSHVGSSSLDKEPFEPNGPNSHSAPPGELDFKGSEAASKLFHTIRMFYTRRSASKPHSISLAFIEKIARKLRNIWRRSLVNTKKSFGDYKLSVIERLQPVLSRKETSTDRSSHTAIPSPGKERDATRHDVRLTHTDGEHVQSQGASRPEHRATGPQTTESGKPTDVSLQHTKPSDGGRKPRLGNVQTVGQPYTTSYARISDPSPGFTLLSTSGGSSGQLSVSKQASLRPSNPHNPTTSTKHDSSQGTNQTHGVTKVTGLKGNPPAVINNATFISATNGRTTAPGDGQGPLHHATKEPKPSGPAAGESLVHRVRRSFSSFLRRPGTTASRRPFRLHPQRYGHDDDDVVLVPAGDVGDSRSGLGLSLSGSSGLRPEEGLFLEDDAMRGGGRFESGLGADPWRRYLPGKRHPDPSPSRLLAPGSLGAREGVEAVSPRRQRQPHPPAPQLPQRYADTLLSAGFPDPLASQALPPETALMLGVDDRSVREQVMVRPQRPVLPTDKAVALYLYLTSGEEGDVADADRLEVNIKLPVKDAARPWPRTVPFSTRQGQATPIVIHTRGVGSLNTGELVRRLHQPHRLIPLRRVSLLARERMEKEKKERLQGLHQLLSQSQPLLTTHATDTDCDRRISSNSAMRCRSNPSICLSDVMMCDGIRDCPMGEDESTTLCAMRLWVHMWMAIHRTFDPGQR